MIFYFYFTFFFKMAYSKLLYSHASAFVFFGGIPTCSVIETVSLVAFVRFENADITSLPALILRAPVFIKWVVWLGRVRFSHLSLSFSSKGGFCYKEEELVVTVIFNTNEPFKPHTKKKMVEYIGIWCCQSNTNKPENKAN